jgi:hypothetical protein
MPLALEQSLMKQAEGKGLTGERKNAYIYGTMRKTGWKPDREKKGLRGFARKEKE